VDSQRVNNRAPMGLNVRSTSENLGTNRLAVLPMGHIVEKTGQTKNQWVEIIAVLQGSTLQGWVNGSFLSPSTVSVLPPVQSQLAVNLDPGKLQVTRNNRLLAYPLNETNMPYRQPEADAEAKRVQIASIIKYLGVDTHARYHPNPSNTYCNIYGFDYCYLNRVYIPRVWWTPNAFVDLKSGRQVAPIYGKTVMELNANSLCQWAIDHSKEFGWVRHFNLDQIQDAANEGLAVVIIAQQKIPNRSGHICAVVSETDVHAAVRANGKVIRPLQSQAGRTNKQYWTPPQWWADPKYKEFGFWVNEY
jgi:hypothetical protein